MSHRRRGNGRNGGGQKDVPSQLDLEGVLQAQQQLQSDPDFQGCVNCGLNDGHCRMRGLNDAMEAHIQEEHRRKGEPEGIFMDQGCSWWVPLKGSATPD